MMGSHLKESVIILCGGLGTRLKSTIGDVPKSLALISGKPFVEYLFDALAEQGATHVIMATGHLGDQLEPVCGDGSRWGLTIEYSREATPLGTAGALRLAEPQCLTDWVVVMNGDSFLPVDYQSLVAGHRHHGGSATMVVSRVQDRRRFGTVAIDDHSRVIDFLEKDAQGEGWVNAGVYVFSRAVLRSLRSGNVSLEEEILPDLARRSDLYAHLSQASLVDIGTPESFAASQLHFGAGGFSAYGSSPPPS